MPRLSPEQKAARKLGIGSSDVAELLGFSPYDGSSPVRLFAEKTGMLGDEPDEEETVEQMVGHALEGALVTLYERQSGRRVLTVGAFVESVVHPELRWARANLDARIADSLGALEVKVVGIGMARDWDPDSDDGIPHYVRVQVAWQMFVADLDEVHVVALIGGTNFRVFYILRDPELEAMVVEEVTRWWNTHVVANVCPPLDASSSTRAYLNLRYPAQADDVEVEVPGSLVPIGLRRLAMSKLEKEAGEAVKIANAEIIAAMGELGATKVWCAEWRASYRPDKNGQRSLLVKPCGEVKVAKPRKRNAKDPPAELAMPVDGDAF